MKHSHHLRCGCGEPLSSRCEAVIRENEPEKPQKGCKPAAGKARAGRKQQGERSKR